MATYYSLIARVDSSSPWGVQFGSYSRGEVYAERKEYLIEYHSTDLEIIITDDIQKSVDIIIAQKNS